MRVIALRLVTTLVLLAFAVQIPAAPLGDLAARLQGLKGLSGTFQQTLLSETGEPLEQSRGDFNMLRPGFLSWHITDPDEQLLVASGESL